MGKTCIVSGDRDQVGRAKCEEQPLVAALVDK